MIVEGGDERYRSLTVASAIRDAIRRRLNGSPVNHPAGSALIVRSGKRRQPAPPKPRPPVRATKQTILSELDMSHRTDAKHYKVELERLQGRLNLLHRKAQRRGISTILVFEGWDAAGSKDPRPLPRRRPGAGDPTPPNRQLRAALFRRFWRHLARPRDD